MSGEGEFGYIRRRLAPLASGYTGAFNLTDDAAVLAVPVGCELVVTSDTLIEGVHFLPGDPPETVAVKALRVSLSDLAAMGAEPHAAMLSISWPRDGSTDLRDRFTDGLAEELSVRAVPLIGGDTTVTPGPWTITGTLFGSLPAGSAVRRAGARAGDHVYVTGTIGDAGLGLLSLQGEAGLGAAVERYRIPPVRTALASHLRGRANAMIDISDGLAADAGHLSTVSQVALDVTLADLPLSGTARDWVARQDDPDIARARLAGYGDDYELLFCAPADCHHAIQRAARETGIPITRIGQVKKGEGVRLLDGSGAPVQIDSAGFTHF
ncbi:thiamine-phosphate kinase [Hyphobacterium marinum]|uniref:Thiamine-monophosphate kinase n=1 Tax=Hyphobacterium marinum TaxID=3116574 RepID=A0ABU7M077_9PROT|nr:thiamine-phosphate kinase [Hyphobacterium sp. Y6023]MEE2566670.1 thiamine-phosphate kinase [Hyphobacterium sp. Y6023]